MPETGFHKQRYDKEIVYNKFVYGKQMNLGLESLLERKC